MRQEHVIQLLAVVVKNVGVSLDRGDVRHLVDIREQRSQGCEN